MDIVVLDAAHMNAFRARKTEARDSEWLAQVLAHRRMPAGRPASNASGTMPPRPRRRPVPAAGRHAGDKTPDIAPRAARRQCPCQPQGYSPVSAPCGCAGTCVWDIGGGQRRGPPAGPAVARPETPGPAAERREPAAELGGASERSQTLSQAPTRCPDAVHHAGRLRRPRVASIDSGWRWIPPSRFPAEPPAG